MNKPLSERLEAEAKLRRGCGQVHIVKLLDDAAALARRVEGAAKVKVRGKVGEVCMVPVSHDYCGQRVALVPVEGVA